MSQCMIFTVFIFIRYRVDRSCQEYLLTFETWSPEYPLSLIRSRRDFSKYLNTMHRYGPSRKSSISFTKCPFSSSTILKNLRRRISSRADFKIFGCYLTILIATVSFVLGLWLGEQSKTGLAQVLFRIKRIFLEIMCF